MKLERRAKLIIDLFVALVLAGITFIAVEVYRSLEEHLDDPVRLERLEWFLVVLSIAIIAVSFWLIVRAISATPFPERLARKTLKFKFGNGTKRRYQNLVNLWAEYVTQGPDPLVWRIRTALAREYVAQEKDDLSGEADIVRRLWTDEKRKELNPEGRPLIITSFIRYSKLVKSMVQAVQESKERSNATILCVTTLSMPLGKWLNFDEKLNCAHPE
jgi:hypothetical protein